MGADKTSKMGGLAEYEFQVSNLKSHVTEAVASSSTATMESLLINSQCSAMVPLAGYTGPPSTRSLSWCQ